VRPGESLDAGDYRKVDPFSPTVLVLEDCPRFFVEDKDEFGMGNIDVAAIGQVQTEGPERRGAQELTKFVGDHDAMGDHDAIIAAFTY
jgi:hypothetical protein